MRNLDEIAIDVKYIEIILRALRHNYFTHTPENHKGDLWVYCSFEIVVNLIELAEGFTKNMSDELFYHHSKAERIVNNG